MGVTMGDIRVGSGAENQGPGMGGGYQEAGCWGGGGRVHVRGWSTWGRWAGRGGSQLVQPTSNTHTRLLIMA